MNPLSRSVLISNCPRSGARTTTRQTNWLNQSRSTKAQTSLAVCTTWPVRLTISTLNMCSWTSRVTCRTESPLANSNAVKMPTANKLNRKCLTTLSMGITRIFRLRTSTWQALRTKSRQALSGGPITCFRVQKLFCSMAVRTKPTMQILTTSQFKTWKEQGMRIPISTDSLNLCANQWRIRQSTRTSFRLLQVRIGEAAKDPRLFRRIVSPCLTLCATGQDGLVRSKTSKIAVTN